MRKALFLHIQKTAGTSILREAWSLYGVPNVISHGDFAALGVEQCRKYDFVSGHFGFGYCRPLMADRYCFTFLRDPIDRLISLYAFCASRQSDDYPVYAAARKLPFDGFLKLGLQDPHFKAALWNNQVWQLASGFGGKRGIDELPPNVLLDMAKENLGAFDHVGFVDTFDADMDVVLRDLGAEPKKLDARNASTNKPDRSKLPASTMVLLRDLTTLDSELYSYAVATKPKNQLRRPNWFQSAQTR